MENESPQTAEIDADGIVFSPVPLTRTRCDGWTRWTQHAFIRALEAMGSVGPAARAVGKSRASAYRLRERPGAESFAAAWDTAISSGRARMFDFALDRALNGITTITVQRGGNVSITGGPDMSLVQSALRPAPGLQATKETR